MIAQTSFRKFGHRSVGFLPSPQKPLKKKWPQKRIRLRASNDPWLGFIPPQFERLRMLEDGRQECFTRSVGPVNVSLFHGPSSIRNRIHVLLSDYRGSMADWVFVGRELCQQEPVLIIEYPGLLIGSRHPRRDFKTFHFAQALIEIFDQIGWGEDRPINLPGVTVNFWAHRLSAQVILEYLLLRLVGNRVGKEGPTINRINFVSPLGHLVCPVKIGTDIRWPFWNWLVSNPNLFGMIDSIQRLLAMLGGGWRFGMAPGYQSLFYDIDSELFKEWEFWNKGTWRSVNQLRMKWKRTANLVRGRRRARQMYVAGERYNHRLLKDLGLRWDPEKGISKRGKVNKMEILKKAFSIVMGPVHIITGEGDPLVYPSYQQSLTQGLREILGEEKVRQTIVQEARHLVQVEAFGKTLELGFSY